MKTHGYLVREFAKLTRVTVRTLHYYDQIGLLRPSFERPNGYRVYTDADLLKLQQIVTLKFMGFSLDEIARMFTADGRPRIDRQALAAKAKELDRTIRELSAMRDGLRHAVACPAPSHMECPTFQRLLRAVTAGIIVPRGRSPARSP